MSGQAGKYARFELERRFLVASRPEATADERGWRISDRYIDDTRLRLRRMEPLGGGDAILKLGQKEVPSPPDYARMTITNVYLSATEHAVLSELPAHELHKVRYPVEHEGRMFGLDVFEGNLSGLILAELGFATAEEMERPLELPPWVIREVSDDIRFTGGALASLTANEGGALIRGAAGGRYRSSR